MFIALLGLVFLLSNVHAQSLFSDSDYDKELKINIITDLQKVLDTGSTIFKGHPEGIPYKGYIQFLDDRGVVTKQIPALFTVRGRAQRRNLRIILPASKTGKAKYLSGSVFEGLKLSSIDQNDLATERYQQLQKYNDQEKIFVNNDGEYSFIKTVNFSGEQQDILVELNSFRAAEIFFPEFQFKTRLFKATYYGCNINSFQDKIFEPKKEGCQIYHRIYNEGDYHEDKPYENLYGFFIEPTKSARERAGLKKYTVTSNNDLLSKLEPEYIIKTQIFGNSPFGSLDWDYPGQEETVVIGNEPKKIIGEESNIAVGYNEFKRKILFAHFDLATSYYGCKLREEASLPKDILQPQGKDKSDMLRAVIRTDEAKYFQYIERIINYLIQNESRFTALAIKHDKLSSDLSRKQSYEMQTCIRDYMADLKKLVDPAYLTKVANERKEKAAFFDSARQSIPEYNIEDPSRDSGRLEDQKGTALAIKNNTTFEQEKYWYDSYNMDLQIHRRGVFTFKNKKYEFEFKNGTEKIYIYPVTERPL